MLLVGQEEKDKDFYRFHILITTYEVVLTDGEFLSQLPWRCLVLDRPRCDWIINVA
jgi:hypothetical protein